MYIYMNPQLLLSDHLKTIQPHSCFHPGPETIRKWALKIAMDLIKSMANNESKLDTQN